MPFDNSSSQFKLNNSAHPIYPRGYIAIINESKGVVNDKIGVFKNLICARKKRNSPN